MTESSWIRTPERVIADDDSLSLLQKVLLTTDGTVTQLLEIYTAKRSAWKSSSTRW